MQYVRQAGGIVFRVEHAAPRILVVAGRQNPRHWIFPKGHVEPGESTAAAALREVREEAAVRAERLDFAGSLEFLSAEGEVRVEYYVMRFLGNAATTEQRRVRWCTYDEALHLLTFDDSRRLLERARPLIEKHLPPGGSSTM
ncbi:MAG: NUDIX hydrolase [Gemmatimonadales bacterium]